MIIFLYYTFVIIVALFIAVVAISSIKDIYKEFKHKDFFLVYH